MMMPSRLSLRLVRTFSFVVVMRVFFVSIISFFSFPFHFLAISVVNLGSTSRCTHDRLIILSPSHILAKVSHQILARKMGFSAWRLSCLISLAL